jgi:type III secretion protein V
MARRPGSAGVAGAASLPRSAPDGIEFELPALCGIEHGTAAAMASRLRQALAAEYGMSLPEFACVGVQRDDALFVLRYEGARIASIAIPPPQTHRFLHLQPGAVAAREADAVDLAPRVVAVPQDAAWPAEAQAVPLAAPEAIELMLRRLVEQRLSQLVTLESTHALLKTSRQRYPEHVAELEKVITPNKLNDLLRRIVSDRIPLQQLRLTYEAAISHCLREKDIAMVAEYVRCSLASMIEERHAIGGVLVCVTLEPELEQFLRESVRQTSFGSYFSLSPDDEAMIEQAFAAAGALYQRLDLPIVTQIDIRRHLKALFSSRNRHPVVLSLQELPATTQLQVVHVIRQP